MMLNDAAQTEIRLVLGDAGYLAGVDVGPRYRSDARGEGDVRPQLVLRPETTDQVSRVMAICHRENQPVVVQGGMTGLVTGARPETGEVVISLERMNRIDNVDAETCTATVQAGTPLQTVQDAADARDGVGGHALAQRLDRLVIQTLNLLQVQPVGAEDFIQTAKRAGQALGAGAGNAGNIQARQKIGQRDTGGKFSRQLARLLGGDTALQQLVGRLAAEAWTLRLMSASVAAKLARGEDPALEATIVKDLGNSYEQAIPQLVQAAVDFGDADAEVLRAVCFYLLQVSPSFSLRGGTREIIRGIIARGLGLR